MASDFQNLLKTDFRNEMKSRFGEFSDADYRLANERIYENFLKLSELSQAKTLMLYYSVNHEVDTIPLIREMLRLGKTVALPVCVSGCDLEARRIEDLEHLRKVRFGLFEPLEGAPAIAPETFDLIVVPGLAFDKDGGRLGHGRGYYDRFLTKTPYAFKLGLSFDFQIVSGLPLTAQDIPMDALLTPSGIYRYKR